jgi:hypothetical protein
MRGRGDERRNEINSEKSLFLNANDEEGTHIILHTDSQGIVDGSVEEVGTEEKTENEKETTN